MRPGEASAKKVMSLEWLNGVVYVRAVSSEPKHHVMDITRESILGNVGIALTRDDAKKLHRWLGRWFKKTEVKKSSKRKARGEK